MNIRAAVIARKRPKQARSARMGMACAMRAPQVAKYIVKGVMTATATRLT